jgi:hypothetical protein
MENVRSERNNMAHTASELSTSELAEQNRRDNLSLADRQAEDALAAEQRLTDAMYPPANTTALVRQCFNDGTLIPIDDEDAMFPPEMCGVCQGCNVGADCVEVS